MRYQTKIILLLLLLVVFVGRVCHAESDWWSDLDFRKVLSKAIIEFSGDTKGDYFYPDGSVASQIGVGLGGPPRPAEALADGSQFLSASRPQSGDEKAAVIMNGNKVITSAALINFECHLEDLSIAERNNHRKVSCSMQPILTILERGSLSSSDLETYLGWARGQNGEIKYEERQLRKK